MKGEYKMDITSTVLVLYTRPYRIVDQKTGQVNEGVSMYYIGTDSMASAADEYSKGYKSIKENLPADFAERFTAVPAYYKAKLTMSSNSEGKATLKMNDITYSAPAVPAK